MTTYVRIYKPLPGQTATELVRMQEIRQQPATYEVNLRQEVMCGEPGHRISTYLMVRDKYDTPKLMIRLIPAYLLVYEYHDTPRLTMVLQRIGLLTGMLLFNMSFYYVLARLVMWAASL